jgi:hypothetical protein
VSTKEIKLPFGLDPNGELVHIKESVNGKDCNLVCPGCGDQLIAANNGTKLQPHFRHDGGAECVIGFESAIHRAAKQLIVMHKKITVPELVVKVEKADSKAVVHTKQLAIVSHGEILKFDFVQQEKMLEGIIADLLAIKDNEQMIIEIFCTHQVDEEKIRKIQDIGLSAIEIDLSGLTQGDVLNWDALWAYMNNHENVTWLHCAHTDNVKIILQYVIEEEIRKAEDKYIKERRDRGQRRFVFYKKRKWRL